MCNCSSCLNDINFGIGEKGDKGDTGPAGTNGTNGTNATGTLTPVVDVVTVNVALTAADTGKLILFDRPDGITVTLPDTPPDGTYYTFEIKDPLTVLPYVINTTAGDLLAGFVYMKKAATADAIFSPVAPSTQISMNGTTTGGQIGTSFRLTFDGIDTWWVSGYIYGSGAVATPFS